MSTEIGHSTFFVQKKWGWFLADAFVTLSQVGFWTAQTGFATLAGTKQLGKAHRTRREERWHRLGTGTNWYLEYRGMQENAGSAGSAGSAGKD